jgi:hypothetical protein
MCEKVDPCPDFPCIHTPCHDPDYLADIEDSCRDNKYHLRLWSNYRKANPLSPVLYKDEESRRKYEEARRRVNEDFAALLESEEDKTFKALHSNSLAAQKSVLPPVDTNPISAEELKEFQTKFDRCRRLDTKRNEIQRGEQRNLVKRKLAEYKVLDTWEDKESVQYRECAWSRDLILATFDPETGDYSWMWSEEEF